MANKHEHHDEEEEAMIKAMMAEPVTNRRFAFFMNEVSNDTVRPICEWIFGNNFDTSDVRPNELTLVINSPGGSLHDAFALIDIMKGSQIPIRTIGLGLVASAGLLIFMAGEKGKRTLTPILQCYHTNGLGARQESNMNLSLNKKSTPLHRRESSDIISAVLV